MKRRKAKRLNPYGYVTVPASKVPGGCPSGRVALEHRVIAARALGRPLPATSIVHHVDGNRSNNKRSNLVVCENQRYHSLLHKRQDAYDACGDANALACAKCGRYDKQDEILTQIVKNGSIRAWHPKCEPRVRNRKKARLDVVSRHAMPLAEDNQSAA